MRILTRYILKEILSHALIGAALFTFVVFMRDVGRIMELVVRNSAPAAAVAEIFLFTLPTALTITIPMGVLVGVLLGLSRLAADSEITAMRATGMGAWHFVRVVAIFSVVAWALALFNNVYLAPHSAASLARLQDRLKTSQASFEIQPRVFYEDFKNYVLYVQDVSAARGAAEWKNIFLADISIPGQPKVTLAQSGLVTQQGESELRLDLQNGEQHSLVENKAGQYEISTFSQSDVLLQLPAATQPQRETVPTAEVSTPELLRLSHDREPSKARWYLVEYHRRLALPAACIVLALVGIPLGLSARKGGKSTGFILTIGLVFLYYFISLLGVSLGRQGKLPPGVGVWLANAIFLITGAVLLFHADKRPLDAGGWLRSEMAHLRAWLRRKWLSRVGEPPGFEAARRRRILWTWFPQILDDYIVRDFLTYAGMMLGSFVLLMLVFTFFELIRDLNRAGWATVGEYLLDSVPSLIYLLLPLAVLVAVLVTFGLMSRANEITAMKATGISIYRVVLPVIIIAAVLATGQFFFDQFYLPRFNRRQETLHNRIKGKPPQTYLNPGRKWIFGEHHSIYYYQFFDPDRGEFGNVNVFEFDPAAFQITKRVFARRAHWESGLSKWVFENGWERQFRGSAIEKYRPYDVTAFDELNEPPTYFRKERQSSSEMSYVELKNYIHDLQQSGFDVVRLKVQLQKKIAFPLITLVMSILAIPFSLAGGRRGALTGVATAIGIGVVYWVTSGVFEAMGNVNQLPPLLAAWSPDILFALGGGYLLLKVQT